MNAKRAARLRAICRRQRRRGLHPVEIAADLGLSVKQVEELLSAKRKFGRNDLDPDAWAEFIVGLTEVDEEGRRLVNGIPLDDESQARAYFRWVEERCAATIFSADRWLCAFDVHIDAFFAFCEDRGLTPWARGEEPDWHREAPPLPRGLLAAAAGGRC